MKHDKGLLKADKLAAFREWLVAAGFEVCDGKGEFQCLQVKTSPTCWAVVGRNTAGVLSTHPDLRTLINLFNAGKPGPSISVGNLIENPRIENPRDEAETFLEDLRDDFAMHALQGLLANQVIVAHIGKATPELAAREAYRFADAMLEARKTKVQRPARKSDTWHPDWKANGYNHCMDQAASALRYLASNERPSGGEQTFNSEHLLQISHEIMVTKRELLAP